MFIHPTSYDGDDQLLFAVCDSTDFIANLYDAIRNFAKRQKKNDRIVQDWAMDAYWEYWVEMMKRRRHFEQIDEAEEIKLIQAIMQKSLKSTKIERYLKERGIHYRRV